MRISLRKSRHYAPPRRGWPKEWTGAKATSPQPSVLFQLWNRMRVLFYVRFSSILLYRAISSENNFPCTATLAFNHLTPPNNDHQSTPCLSENPPSPISSRILRKKKWGLVQNALLLFFVGYNLIYTSTRTFTLFLFYLFYKVVLSYQDPGILSNFLPFHFHVGSLFFLRSKLLKLVLLLFFFSSRIYFDCFTT